MGIKIGKITIEKEYNLLANTYDYNGVDYGVIYFNYTGLEKETNGELRSNTLKFDEIIDFQFWKMRYITTRWGTKYMKVYVTYPLSMMGMLFDWLKKLKAVKLDIDDFKKVNLMKMAKEL